GERIAKRLARAVIEAGRVTVNGKVLNSPAFNVQLTDHIEVDGAPIPAIERTRLFLFHKPAGVVTTNRDPEGRRTVFDILPEGLPRLLTVGRLDINTEGLLLLTNDGGLARVLELPSTGWLRRYRVRVHGKVDPKALEGLKDGIAVDGVFYGAVEAVLDREQGSNAWLTIGLREGKNREVRNILGALGLEVNRLIRISYGPFQLGALPEGAVQEIRGRTLRDQLGERLISEAGANFDAPITKPFSSNPVGDAKPAPESAPAKKREKDAPVVEKRPLQRRRRSREEVREDALGRLQTKPERRGSGAGGHTKPADAPRPHSSNVWMAPGARPMGKKKEAAADSKAAARPQERKGGKPGSYKRAERHAGGKPDRKGGKPDSSKRPGGKPHGSPRANERPRPAGSRSGGPRGRGPGKGPGRR
ncbi:pseudouridine synthase, partial [Mesorhizobium sp. J18]|uniref:pseudouridine synthase n=1 Tax=Mesorhizobium sp. J18 TaxID=935263 RepID=UPI0011A465F7